MTETLKGLGEAFDHLIYELVGLVVPGATVVFLIALLTGRGSSSS